LPAQFDDILKNIIDIGHETGFLSFVVKARWGVASASSGRTAHVTTGRPRNKTMAGMKW